MKKSPPAVKGVSAGTDDLGKGRESHHRRFLGSTINKHHLGMNDVELAGCGVAGMN